MGDLIEFEGDLDAFAKQVGIDYTKVVKHIAFDLFGRIVKKTPVDTGRARASWNITIGEVDTTVAPEGQQPEMNTWAAEAKAATALATLTERAVFTRRSLSPTICRTSASWSSEVFRNR